MFDITKYLGLPINVSTHGQELDYMLGLVHWLMIILFVIWAPFFVYVLVRFRASKNPEAVYTGTKSHVSSYLEVAVVIAEAVLLIGFAIPIWAELKVDSTELEDPNALEINVIAEQFAWNVHYPGNDGLFGRRDIDLVDTQSNPLGLDPDDPNGKDDITTINDLRIPVNKKVLVHLSSKDVIHCFNLPVLRVKQDIIPGLSIPVNFTAIKTGEFDLGCAQLCGLGHYRMHGDLTILTQSEFDEWLRAALEEKLRYASLSSD